MATSGLLKTLSPHFPRGARARRFPQCANFVRKSGWAVSGAGGPAHRPCSGARLPTSSGSAPARSLSRGAGVSSEPLLPTLGPSGENRLPRQSIHSSPRRARGDPARRPPGRGVGGGVWRALLLVQRPLLAAPPPPYLPYL